MNEPLINKIMKQIEEIYEENKKLKQINQVLEKLLELNMKDLHDIVDQRDWYYEEYRRLKDGND